MRQNRSFARRVGKTLSPLRKSLLAESLPQYLWKSDSLIAVSTQYKAVFLEIGFGMGEHLIAQATENPEALYIGVDPYLNGVSNALRLIVERKLSNILLYPDDIDLVLDQIPQHGLDGVYILFPDPWPKKRQQKKRLVNSIRLSKLLDILKNQGFFMFVSDNADYTSKVADLCRAIPNLQEVAVKQLQGQYQYKPTKYHLKAQAVEQPVNFLCFNYNQ